MPAPPGGDPMEKLSREIVNILRHRHQELRVPVQNDGWAELEDVLRVVGPGIKQRVDLSKVDYNDLARKNARVDRPRFETRYGFDGRLQIRALEGGGELPRNGPRTFGVQPSRSGSSSRFPYPREGPSQNASGAKDMMGEPMKTFQAEGLDQVGWQMLHGRPYFVVVASAKCGREARDLGKNLLHAVGTRRGDVSWDPRGMNAPEAEELRLQVLEEGRKCAGGYKGHGRGPGVQHTKALLGKHILPNNQTVEAVGIGTCDKDAERAMHVGIAALRLVTLEQTFVNDLCSQDPVVQELYNVAKGTKGSPLPPPASVDAGQKKTGKATKSANEGGSSSGPPPAVVQAAAFLLSPGAASIPSSSSAPSLFTPFSGRPRKLGGDDGDDAGDGDTAATPTSGGLRPCVHPLPLTPAESMSGGSAGLGRRLGAGAGDGSVGTSPTPATSAIQAGPGRRFGDAGVAAQHVAAASSSSTAVSSTAVPQDLRKAPMPLTPKSVSCGESECGVVGHCSVASDVDTASSESDDLKAHVSRRRLRTSLGDRVAYYTAGCLMLVPRSEYRRGEFRIEARESPTKVEPALPPGFFSAGPRLQLEPHEKRFKGIVWLVIPTCKMANRLLRSKPDGTWEELENCIFREGYAVVGVRHFCDVWPVSEGQLFSLLFEPFYNTSRKRVQVVAKHRLWQECVCCKNVDEEYRRGKILDGGWMTTADPSSTFRCRQGDRFMLSVGAARNDHQTLEYHASMDGLPDELDAMVWEQGVDEPQLVIQPLAGGARKTMRLGTPEDIPVMPFYMPEMSTTTLLLSDTAGASQRLRVTCGASQFRTQSREKRLWDTLAEFFRSDSQLRHFHLRFEDDDKYYMALVCNTATDNNMDFNAFLRDTEEALKQSVERRLESRHALGHIKVLEVEINHDLPPPSDGRPIEARPGGGGFGGGGDGMAPDGRQYLNPNADPREPETAADEDEVSQSPGSRNLPRADAGNDDAEGARQAAHGGAGGVGGSRWRGRWARSNVGSSTATGGAEDAAAPHGGHGEGTWT